MNIRSNVALSLSLLTVPLWTVLLLSLAGCPAGGGAKTPSSETKAKPVANSGAESAVTSGTGALDLKSADPAAAAQSVPYGDAKRPAIDPIAANGKIFEGWPKPKLALVITGDQNGYIEPCGCTGRENQLGGLARRHSFFKKLAADGWPTVAVDLGGIVDRFGRQAELKYQITGEAMQKMGYAAIAFGPKDLRLPATDLISVTSREDSPSPFVSANVNLLDQTQPFRIIEEGGMKIGVTSILGDAYQREINNSELKLSPAEASLAAVMPKLKAAGCDRLILLSHATQKESEALARKFPAFSIVVTADGAEVPPNLPKRLEGTDTLLIEVGSKGKYAIVLGLYDDAKEPVRYQRVPLDARFADSKDMLDLMVAFQGQLEQLGFENLGIRPKIHPRAKGPGDATGQFVGSTKCGECHKIAFDIWSKSKHAHATESLVKANPPRIHDPECLSCHTTGWNAQEFYPYQSGYVSLAETPQLQGNGCENCHGPGGAHVAAETGRDLALRDKQRQTLRLTQATVELNVCVKCHDDDNDPHFNGNFAKYWQKIEHKGMR
ncbi:MAG TPA: multiheme c-type cytochrome [Pirellulales bacterium]|jgi:hypothetical protein